MQQIEAAQLDVLSKSTMSGMLCRDSFPAILGGRCIANGVWRFYSSAWPITGIDSWNRSSTWRHAWQGYLPEGIYFLGDDVFGNQIGIIESTPNTLLWDHESGELYDLYLEPTKLLMAVAEHGIGWIDYYRSNMLSIAQQRMPIDKDQHLHWLTPLILNGRIEDSNLGIIERESHLIGHAQLLKQLRGTEPGDRIVTR